MLDTPSSPGRTPSTNTGKHVEEAASRTQSQESNAEPHATIKLTPAAKGVQFNQKEDAESPKNSEKSDLATVVAQKVSETAIPSTAPIQPRSLEEFSFQKTIYKGKITQVFHAIDNKTGVSLAIKAYNRYNLSMVERYQVAREIKLHTSLYHAGIIKMYAAWKDDRHVYMALEWAAGGDLSKFIRSHGNVLSESVAVEMVVDPLLMIIDYIHEEGIVHRDLKPENVLMTSSLQLKLADFQMAIDSNEEIPNSRLGTIAYIAPEILLCPAKKAPSDFKQDKSIGYTSKVDVWSVGIMVYEMLTGNTPFAAPNATTEQLIHNILQQDISYPKFLSANALDFLKSALQKHPKRRATIQQLMGHPWLRKATQRRESIRSPGSTLLPNLSLKKSNTANLN